MTFIILGWISGWIFLGLTALVILVRLEPSEFYDHAGDFEDEAIMMSFFIVILWPLALVLIACVAFVNLLAPSPQAREKRRQRAMKKMRPQPTPQDDDKPNT